MVDGYFVLGETQPPRPADTPPWKGGEQKLNKLPVKLIPLLSKEGWLGHPRRGGSNQNIISDHHLQIPEKAL